jgi:hypothetical protein
MEVVERATTKSNLNFEATGGNYNIHGRIRRQGSIRRQHPGNHFFWIEVMRWRAYYLIIVQIEMEHRRMKSGERRVE